MTPIPTLIADGHALTRFTPLVESTRQLAVDTEFMREKTYRAELCLLQLAADGWQTCVDPLAIDPAQVAAELCAHWQSADCTLILHAARQDLEVLVPLLGAPRGVFDTQVAAALAGLPPQIGYAELVRRLLGVELKKAETRTDWSRRPLSAAQLDYALDDVRYLPALREALLTMLERLGRTSWLAEELTALEDPALLEVRPEAAWQRIKGLQDLDAARLTLVQRLAAWREQRAIARNRPRGWILDDTVLRAMVMEPPRNLAQLAAVPEMPRGVVEHVGAELLAVIESCELPDTLPAPPRRSRPDPALEATAKRLSGVLRDIAGSMELSPEVLATRRDLEQIARGQRDAAPLNGWRRDIIGNKLLAALG